MLDVNEGVNTSKEKNIDVYKIDSIKDIRRDDSLAGLYPKLKTMTLNKNDNINKLPRNFIFTDNSESYNSVVGPMQNMKDLSNISVVLPSLDPDEKLNAVIDGLLEYGFSDIILVNDGSKQENLHYCESSELLRADFPLGP